MRHQRLRPAGRQAYQERRGHFRLVHTSDDLHSHQTVFCLCSDGGCHRGGQLFPHLSEHWAFPGGQRAETDLPGRAGTAIPLYSDRRYPHPHFQPPRAGQTSGRPRRTGRAATHPGGVLRLAERLDAPTAAECLCAAAGDYGHSGGRIYCDRIYPGNPADDSHRFGRIYQWGVPALLVDPYAPTVQRVPYSVRPGRRKAVAGGFTEILQRPELVEPVLQQTGSHQMGHPV